MSAIHQIPVELVSTGRIGAQSYAQAEGDAGRAVLAVLLSPVTVEDLGAVNVDRATMPRKSTWFTPKARTGLVLADVHADLADVQPEALSR